MLNGRQVTQEMVVFSVMQMQTCRRFSARPYPVWLTRNSAPSSPRPCGKIPPVHYEHSVR